MAFKGVGNERLQECWIVPLALSILGPIHPIFELFSKKSIKVEKLFF